MVGRDPFDQLVATAAARGQPDDLWDSDLEGGPARIAERKAAAAQGRLKPLDRFEKTLAVLFARERKRARDALATVIAGCERELAEVLADAEDAAEARFAALEQRIAAVETRGGGEARGLFDEKGVYKKFDHVSHDGSEWIARRDDPGLLPGAGWMLGAKGSKGRPGERGPAGAGLVGITGHGTSLIFSTNDGKRIAVDLRPLVAAAVKQAKERA